MTAKGVGSIIKLTRYPFYMLGTWECVSGVIGLISSAEDEPIVIDYAPPGRTLTVGADIYIEALTKEAYIRPGAPAGPNHMCDRIQFLARPVHERVKILAAQQLGLRRRELAAIAWCSREMVSRAAKM